MDFGPIPPASDQSPATPGEMRIEGPSSNRVWGITRWFVCVIVIAGVLISIFQRFGSTIAWSIFLVGFMLLYMGMMGRWAGGDRERR